MNGILYVLGNGFIRLSANMWWLLWIFCSLVCSAMAIGDIENIGNCGCENDPVICPPQYFGRSCVALGIASLINPGIAA